MPDPIYYLSEEDRNELDRDIEQRRKQPVSIVGQPDDQRWNRFEKSYVALPPCNECIPARVNDVPGRAECCIFLLSQRTGASHEIYDIEPLYLNDGSILRELVYNIYDAPACHPYYIKVHRERGGRWVCDRPSGSTTTSTTPAPTGNFGIPTGSGGCSGQCKWVWDNEAKKWDLDNDGCAQVTTTSTSPNPSTTSTSTTPSTCQKCPTTTTPGPTTTTPGGPTTTTTTTTAAPCACLEPNYCGTDDCEVTYTNCAPPSQKVVPPDCGSTTTTTSTTTTSTTNPCGGDCEVHWDEGDEEWIEDTNNCTGPDGCGCEMPADPGEDENPITVNCAQPTTTTPDPCTTTTTTPGNCTAGCDWFAHPLYGWVQTSNGCDGACPCDHPTPDQFDCSTTHTNCVVPPPTSPPPPPPTCLGQCRYVCIDTDTWFLLTPKGCSTIAGCDCAEPTAPCTVCDETQTPCVSNTTTTPNPCTSTTSSTTTTPNCLTSKCKWRWEVGATEWTLEVDECPSECPCSNTEPTHTGEDCETVEKVCGPPPTTTTTSTSTTGPPTTTTTTTTSTTTTTTSCGPCDPGLGDCVYVWHGGDDVSGWELVSDGCGNGFCESNTPPVPEAPPCTCGFLDGCGTTTSTTTTTTTAPPTTTSSTTPCPNADPNNCMWRFSESTWTLYHDNGCTGMCDPPAGGGSEGECQQTPCL